MLLDGKLLQDNIIKQIREEVMELLTENFGAPLPTLAIVRVGSDVGTDTYVKQKVKYGDSCHYRVKVIDLDEYMDTEYYVDCVKQLNSKEYIHGIIVQLPLPDYIDERAVINAISPEKDVDCLTDNMIGRLHSGNSMFKPCTPLGIMDTLEEYNLEIEGKRVLIINRSNLVGKPLAELMTQSNATVTLAHSKTPKDILIHLMKNSDIIVTGVKIQDFITQELVQQIQGNDDRVITLIDVSMNRGTDGKLCGDVSKEVYGMTDVNYTPVPGGVGRTTVAALMKNVLLAYKNQNYL